MAETRRATDRRFGLERRHAWRRKADGLRPATWDEALDFIAGKLKAVKAEKGPDAIAALSSAKCTNEENYLMQKFMRAVIGTNNVDHCARL